MKRVLSCLLLAALAAGAPPPARAASGPMLVLVVGSLDELALIGVRTSAEARLRELGVATAATTDAKLASTVSLCAEADDACRRKHLGPAGAKTVLLIRVDVGKAKDGEPVTAVSANIYDGASGAHVVGEQRFCTRCTAVEALDSTVREVIDAVLKAEVKASGATGTLILRSTPPGARVSVDGSPVGVTETRYTVYPGVHQVRLELEGYEPGASEVNLAADETKVVAVELVPRGATAGGPGASRLRTVGYVVGGVGLAAIAGGVVLMAIDDPRVEGGARASSYRESFTPGLYTTIGGAALLGTGVALWFIGKPAAPVTAAALPVDGGWAFTVAGEL
jgi:hypothetical protein